MSNKPLEPEYYPESGEDAYTLLLNGLCHELLESKIPTKLRDSVRIKKVVDAALVSEGLETTADSSLYFTKDYLADEIPSYRMRLVPRELHKGILYRNSEIKSLIVNIPDPFMQDPAHAEGISLCLVGLQLDDNTTLKYAIAATQIIPYEDFSSLDFQFDESGNDFRLVVDTRGNTPTYISISDQIEIARLVYRMLDGEYVIGRQSRHDGTIRN